MRVLTPLSFLLLALGPLTSGCAAKSSATRAPDDYGEASPGNFASESAASTASPAPAPEPGALAASPTATLPSTLLGSVAPARAVPAAGESGAEPAIAELDTIGADSVDQMLIFTGQLAIEIEFASTPQTVDAAVAIAVESGGYVAEMTDATLRLRVPSKRFRRTMREIEALGDVRSRGVQALDVSEEFHDLQVRLDNLQATRSRIQKLLGQAKDLSEILTIEKELERVTAEIDRIQGHLRLLASQAAFSTIAVAFAERPDDTIPKVIAGGGVPAVADPRTLPSSATWVGEVGIHRLLRFDATTEKTRR